MPEFLQRLLSGALSLSIVALPLVLCAPMLARHYQQKTLYRIMLILTLAFLLMPFRPAAGRSIVVLPVPDAPVLNSQASFTLPQESITSDKAPFDRYTNETPPSGGNPVILPVSASETRKEHSHPAAIPLSLILPEKQAIHLSPWQIVILSYSFTAAGLLLFHLIRHMRFTRHLRRWQGIRLRGCYEIILQEECQLMHIRRIPAMYLCEAAPSPMLLGTLRPRIYLPDESLTEKELRLVLRHELTHLKRLDIPCKTISLISLCLNWFNPLCHVLYKQTDYYCETSCDERVLRNASWTDVERYTSTILSTLRRSARLHSALSTHFSGGKKRMKNRIMTMMDASQKRLGALVCALVIILTASSSTLFTFGHAENQDAAQSTTAYLTPDQPYTQTDAYQTLANALGIKGEPHELGELPQSLNAYTHNPLAFAVPANNGPTSWSMPNGQYLPGVPVEIIGYQHTEGTISGYTDPDGMIYALCRVLGDDTLECYIPLVFLSVDKGEKPACTMTLTTADPIGFVTVYTQRSADSVPLNAYQEGTEVQVIGRQSGWYHVQIGESTGYVQAENAILSERAQELFDNQLFRFEGFLTAELLGEGEKLNTYNRIIEQAFELYGSEKAYWTMEQRAWYSQITKEYGYLAEGMDVNLLPDEEDMTQEQALEKALAIIRENVDAEPNPDWFAISYAYFYSWGDDPENARWRIGLWPIDRRASRYAVTMDKQGNCVQFYEDPAKTESQILQTWGTLYDFDQYFSAHPGATQEDMPADMQEVYLQWKADDFRFYANYNEEMTTAYSDAEKLYGINNYFWPLDVRMNIFGGDNTLPREGEMTLEQAQQKAVQALINELGQEALDALGNYKVGATLQRIDEGLETEFTRWMIFVTDNPDTMLNGYRMVFVDKGSDRLGDGVEIKTIDDTSNG